jgi:hypothetical protein
MFAKLFISIALLAPVQLLAQSNPPVSKAVKDTAVAELESVIAESGKLDDKLAFIKVKARSAALVSLSDPARAEMMFLEIWVFAKAQTDKEFDQEQARALILKSVFPRNQKLAKRLLEEEAKGEETSLDSRARGRDATLSRRATLASQLIDDDPRAASEILEGSLASGMTPAGLNALLRLRQKDALLSDFVVGKTLEGLKTQPDVVALSGLHLLSAYLFPEGNSDQFYSSLQSLQIQYFSTAYDVLRASLAESEEVLLKDRHYSKAALSLRAMYQARIAVTLAALAPRYQPVLAGELSVLANKLGSRLPPDVAQLAKLNSARLAGNQTPPDKPELAIPLAIQSGDYEEAERLIDDVKSDDMRKVYSQVLARARTRTLLSQADVLAALTQIRKIEDQNARLAFYLEAVQPAQRKHDPSLSSLVINEARSLIPRVDRNGLHVRALLAFAAQLPALASPEEAMDFLAAAVVAINSLPKQAETSKAAQSSMERAWAEINDPLSLSELPEFANAFSSIGIIDLERTIIEARKIAIKPVQLLARLEAAGEVLRIDSRRSKSKPAIKTAARAVQ